MPTLIQPPVTIIMKVPAMSDEEREKRIRHGRFSNSAHGQPWNKNRSPKSYGTIAQRASRSAIAASLIR